MIEALAEQKDIDLKRQTYEIAKLIADHKGLNVRICSLEGYSQIASYMIIVSGSSTRHTSAIAHAIIDEYHVPQSRIEGLALGDWILVDLGDIIVHVFEQANRDYYMFDRTWSHVPSHLYVEENRSEPSSLKRALI